MAHVVSGGFELGVLDTWWSPIASSGTRSVQSSVVRTGGYAFRANPTTTGTGFAGVSFCDATSGATVTDMSGLANNYFRVYFRYATKPATTYEEILSIRGTGNQRTMSVTINSAGQLGIRFIDGVLSPVGPGSTVLAQDTWYRIEVLFTAGASGAVELKIDGVVELSTSGDVNNGQTPSCWILGKRTDLNSETVDFYYDDYVIDDSDYPGPGRVAQLIPTANGTFSAWSNGTGASDWTQVSVIPTNLGSTYVQNLGSVDGECSTFQLTSSATAGIEGSVKSVLPYIIASNPAGGPQQMKVRTIVGGTNTDQFNFTWGGGAAIMGYPLNANPVTAANWAVDDLTGMQAGPFMGFSSGGRTLRCWLVSVNVAFNDEETTSSDTADNRGSATWQVIRRNRIR